MKNVLQSTERVANTDAAVLVRKSGVGKELVARYPLKAKSIDKPFIVLLTVPLCLKISSASLLVTKGRCKAS